MPSLSSYVSELLSSSSRYSLPVVGRRNCRFVSRDTAGVGNPSLGRANSGSARAGAARRGRKARRRGFRCTRRTRCSRTRSPSREQAGPPTPATCSQRTSTRCAGPAASGTCSARAKQLSGRDRSVLSEVVRSGRAADRHSGARITLESERGERDAASSPAPMVAGRSSALLLARCETAAVRAVGPASC
jgi:hypothetical protein